MARTRKTDSAADKPLSKPKTKTITNNIKVVYEKTEPLNDKPTAKIVRSKVKVVNTPANSAYPSENISEPIKKPSRKAKVVDITEAESIPVKKPGRKAKVIDITEAEPIPDKKPSRKAKVVDLVKPTVEAQISVNETTLNFNSKSIPYDSSSEQSLRVFEGCTNVQEALDRLAVVLVPCTSSYDGLMTFADKTLLNILLEDSRIIYNTFVARKNQKTFMLDWLPSSKNNIEVYVDGTNETYNASLENGIISFEDYMPINSSIVVLERLKKKELVSDKANVPMYEIYRGYGGEKFVPLENTNTPILVVHNGRILENTIHYKFVDKGVEFAIALNNGDIVSFRTF